MPSQSYKESAKEISTDAIASFVYGTIQLTLVVSVGVLLWYMGSKFGEMFSMASTPAAPPQELDECRKGMGIVDSEVIERCEQLKSTIPPPVAVKDAATEYLINFKEVIFIFVSNILSFFGIFTGISALVDISKTDKIGDNLATLGLFSSIICLGATVLFVWIVDLPL